MAERFTPRDDLRPGLRTLAYRRRVTFAFMVEDAAAAVIGFYYGGQDFETLLRDERLPGRWDRFAGAPLVALFLLCSKQRARPMTEEIAMTDLSMRALLEPYDWNLPLKDALDDVSLSSDRRALAAAAMRQDLDDGHYAAAEVLEAFRALEQDIDSGVGPFNLSEGEARVKHILDGEGDDYQRRLYFLLAERPVAAAVQDLEWLVAVMKGRAGMFRTLRQAGARMASLPGEEQAGEDDPIGCRPFGH